MTGPTRFDDSHEEPDQLRDQLRQLVRYRALIVLGVVLGLLGAAAMSAAGGDTYTSTGEVVVQPISTTPFDSGASTPDKQLSMGTEKQIAQSETVAKLAARRLKEPAESRRLQRSLRVSNPPDTQTLQFEYTEKTPKGAADGVNAFVQAYLDYRENSTKDRINTTVGKLNSQLGPQIDERKRLDRKIAGESEGPAKDTDEAARGSLVTQISDLQGKISSLKSLDTTPGDVVREGDPPAFPSGPGLTMLLVIGAVIGAAAGIIAAWIRSVLEPRVRSVADVQNNLRAPVLGILPRHKKRPLLVVGRAATGNLAEAYRTIAFRLAHDQRYAGRGSILVVAPRDDGDAAAVAVNLAGAFSEIGNRVLLVEADLRSPRLGVDLPVSTDGGTAESSAAWPQGQRLVVDAGEAGEFGLVPGRRVPNVARVLSSPQVTRMLATPSDPDESVVVLTRPLLTHADGLAVAKRVDGVLVVCDLQRVRRDDLDRVRELIGGAGGRILGAVLDKGPKRGRLRRILSGGPSHRAFRGTGGGYHTGQERGGAESDDDYLVGDPDDQDTARELPQGRNNGLMTYRR